MLRKSDAAKLRVTHRVGADRQLGIEDDGIAPPREVDVLL